MAGTDCMTFAALALFVGRKRQTIASTLTHLGNAMIRSSVVAYVALALALVSVDARSLVAQQSRGQLQSSFAARSPSIGSELPDASGYTADGKPFNLRELKGKYTVIVFGCLT